MNRFLKKSFLTPLLSSFIVLSIVLVSYAPVFQKPKEAEAQWAVIDGTNLIQNTVTAVKSVITAVQSTLSAGYELISAWGTKILTLKEGWLDGIAWYAINLILHQLAQSTIQWINSGFKGSPAFVTDLGGYMRDIGDKVAGEFLNGTSLAFLCSPFRLDVQLALKLQYGQGKSFNSQCTLSGAVNNMEAFLAGDFLAGGWDGWFKMTSDPRNNPYGALLMAQEELSMRVSSARGQEMSSLNFSKGFLSVKECVETVNDPSGGRLDGTCKRYETVTPGTAIEHQLNTALDIPTGRLLVADEINEIIAALLGQLVKKAFAGAGGLRGMTNSSFGAGSGSYFNELSADKTTLGFNYHDTSTPQQYMNSWGNLTAGVTQTNAGSGGTGGTGTVGGSCTGLSPEGIPYNNKLPMAPLTNWTGQQQYDYWITIPAQTDLQDPDGWSYNGYSEPIKYAMWIYGNNEFRNLVRQKTFGGSLLRENQWVNGNDQWLKAGMGFDYKTGIGNYGGSKVYPPSGIPPRAGCVTSGGGSNACVPPTDPISYRSDTREGTSMDTNNYGHTSLRYKTPTTPIVCTYNGVPYPSQVVTEVDWNSIGKWQKLDAISTPGGVDIRTTRTAKSATIYRFKTPPAGSYVSAHYGYQNDVAGVSDVHLSLSMNPCDFSANNLVSEKMGSFTNVFKVVKNAYVKPTQGQLEPDSIYYLTVLDLREEGPTDDGWIDGGDRVMVTWDTGVDNNPPAPNACPLASGGSGNTQTGTVSISSISPSSGPVNTNVILTGTGFSSSGNTVTFSQNGITIFTIPNQGASSGKITFTIPAIYAPTCPVNMSCVTVMRNVSAGNYSIAVKNSSGATSNSVGFNISSGSSSSGTVGATGVCGTANGGKFTTRPSSNLCSIGTPSSVISDAYWWTWSCAGLTSSVSCLGWQSLGSSTIQTSGATLTINPTIRYSGTSPILDFSWGNVIHYNDSYIQWINNTTGYKVYMPLNGGPSSKTTFAGFGEGNIAPGQSWTAYIILEGTVISNIANFTTTGSGSSGGTTPPPSTGGGSGYANCSIFDFDTVNNDCTTASNYNAIKAACCPNGTITSCTSGPGGALVTGVGCN